MTDHAAPPTSRGPHAIVTACSLGYMLLSLSWIRESVRGGVAYPVGSMITDFVFTSLTLVLLAGLWRQRAWGSHGLAALAGARLAAKLGRLAQAAISEGLQEFRAPGPAWLLRVALLVGILVFALRARPRVVVAGAP